MRQCSSRLSNTSFRRTSLVRTGPSLFCLRGCDGTSGHPRLLHTVASASPHPVLLSIACMPAIRSEFSPYVFQILAQLLECRTSLSPAYSSLFSPILAPTMWERIANTVFGRLKFVLASQIVRSFAVSLGEHSRRSCAYCALILSSARHAALAFACAFRHCTNPTTMPPAGRGGPVARGRARRLSKTTRLARN